MKKLVSIILMLAIMSVCIVPVFAEDGVEDIIATAWNWHSSHPEGYAG